MINQLHVKMYGQPTSKYRYIKERILERAQAASITVDAEEISDWSLILQSNIEAIPAVELQDHSHFHYTGKTEVEAFADHVSIQVLKKNKFGQMKKIIVPVDFSEASAKALQYARRLAIDLNGVVEVLYAYHPPAVEVQGAIITDPGLEDTRREQLAQFIDKVDRLWEGKPEEKPLMDINFRIGYAAQEIRDVCRNEPNALVVLSSSGEQNALKTLFGSVTTEMARRCEAPVLIIPPMYEFKEIKHIAFAVEHSSLKYQQMKAMHEMSKSLAADIHFVHIKNDESEWDEELITAQWREHYADGVVHCHSVRNEDVISGLQSFLQAQNIDCLAVTPGERGFFKQLFHKSIRRSLALNTQLPLLILHSS